MKQILTLAFWSLCSALALSQTPDITRTTPAFEGQLAPAAPTGGKEQAVSFERAEDDAPCDGIPTLTCEQSFSGSTANGVNNFNNTYYTCWSTSSTYAARDVVYRVSVTQKSSVHFVLEMAAGIDLDMFLKDNCNPGGCRAFATKNSNGIAREILDVNLDVGTYYLMIDGSTSAMQGAYTISMNCTCDCSEPAGDQPAGETLFCDNFEEYALLGVNAQSSRWYRLNVANTTDATVAQTNGNKAMKLEYQANQALAPMVTYFMGAQSSGRFRVSWRIFVENNKKGFSSIYYTSGNNVSKAFDIVFYEDKTGRVTSGSTQVGNFKYQPGQWLNAMCILDLDNNVAEFWIDKVFVSSWAYTHSNFSDLLMYAPSTYSYRVDNVCIWKRDPNCNPGFIPKEICVKNNSGSGYYWNEEDARCDLYTSGEWTDCDATICDYGGTFIYRGDNYAGTLEPSDFAPYSVRDLSCVKNAYSQNVPASLFADTYVFYHDNINAPSPNNNIGVNIKTTPNSTVRAFVMRCRGQDANAAKESGAENNSACVDKQECPTEIPINSSTGIGSITLGAFNSCSRFYYIVVTGKQGDTYFDLNIIPNGECDNVTNPPTPLACGATANGSLATGTGNTFFQSGAGKAYGECYNGTMSLNGRETVYKFMVTEPQKTTLTLTPQAPMAIFLYSFLCGRKCIGYAEAQTAGVPVTLESQLTSGSYYVVVDRLSSAGAAANFSLKLDCSNYSQFITYTTFAGDTDCPTDPTQVHDVLIPSTAYSFSSNDQLHFLYTDGSGLLTSSDSLSKRWNNGPDLPFKIQADLNDGPEKCSYTAAELFKLYVIKSNGGSGNMRKMKLNFAAANSSGLNAGNAFQVNGKSRIETMTEDGIPITFSPEYTFRRFGPGMITDTMLLETNLAWTATKTPNVGWLTLTPPSDAAGGGASEVQLKLDPNPTNVLRSTTIEFKATNRPEIRQFVRIEQQGQCAAPTLSASASVGSICQGNSVTFSANITAPTGVANEYRYLWNTGDTSRNLVVIPPVTGQVTYAVTITHKYCFRTANASATITVHPLPAPPTGTSPITVCAGTPVTLSVGVSSPATTARWYNSSNTLLHTGLDYTINNPTADATFFVESVSAVPCASATRKTIQLKVNPLPAKPVAQGSATFSICQGQPMPTLAVVGVSGIAMEWFNQATGGGLPLMTSNTFMPPPPANPGTYNYYAQARNTTTQCISALPRTVFTVTVKAVPPPPDATTTQYAICESEAMPILMVTTTGGATVKWYDQATGGLEKGSGPSFTPPPLAAPGVVSYFAEAEKDGCVSASRRAFSITVRALPTLEFLDTICAADRLTYTVKARTNGASMTASTGTPEPKMGDIFTFSGIPINTSTVLTATSSDNCKRQLSIVKKQCACPTVPNPSDGKGQTMCEDAAIPALTVKVAPGYTAYWYDSEQAQQPLPGGIKTTTFTPAAAQTATYFAAAYDSVSHCFSAGREAATLTVNPSPALTANAPMCAPNLLTYSVVGTSTGTVQPPASGVLTQNGTAFEVAGVPKGTALALVSTALGCVSELLVQGDSCKCPTVLKPISEGDQSVCSGQPLPALSVRVGEGQTADWFDMGGNPKKEGDTHFAPQDPGTYFAQARDTTTQCLSSQKTAVTLSILPLPTFSEVSAACTGLPNTYDVTLRSNATSLSATFGDVAQNPDGTFHITQIPIGNPVQITAKIDSTGCLNVLGIDPPQCSCPSVPSPKAAKEVVEICTGQAPPPLSVSVESGLAAYWYAVPTGGLPIANGSNTPAFTPPAPVTDTFFVENRSTLVDSCRSAVRTRIIFTVNPVPILTLDTRTCALNLKTYDARVKSNAPVTASNFSVQDNADGTYTIQKIPVGLGITALAKDPGTGCQTSLPIAPLTCPCPVVSKPESLGDKDICENTPTPLLEVKVANPALETVRWYSSQTGSDILADSTTTYLPATAGEYWAQAHYRYNDGCFNPSRTKVELKIRALPIVKAGDDQVVCSDQEVDLAGAVQGVSGGFWASSVLGGSFKPGPGWPSAKTYKLPPSNAPLQLVLSSNDPAGPCPAVSDTLNISVHPVPDIQVDTVFCNDSLTRYSVVFSTPGEINLPGGYPFSVANGLYRVSGIPKDSSLTIYSAFFQPLLCDAQKVVQGGGTCKCLPLAPPEPLSPLSASVCSNAPKPVFAVKPLSGLIVKWFDNAGQLIEPEKATLQAPSAGIFRAKMVDPKNQCSSDALTFVAEIRTAPIADAGADKTICPGKSATLTAAEGQDYEYLWSTQQTTRLISVSPDSNQTYYLTVTANNCEARDSAAVKVRPSIQATLAATEPLCQGQSSGSLTVVSSSGPQIIAYLWSTGGMEVKALQLPAGTYTVTLTDGNTCTITRSATLTDPPQLYIASSSVNDALNGKNDGQVTATAAGGTPPHFYQWYSGSTALPGETSPTLDSVFAGDYRLKITDSKGCVVEQIFTVKNTVDVDEAEEERMIRFYPNPTNGLLNIRFDLPELCAVHLSVFNLAGQLVRQQTVGMVDKGVHTLDLSDLPSGVYALRTNVADHRPFYRKIIVNR